jgi:hypothetical protein
MASLAFMVLVKELSVLFVIPFLAFVLYERFARRVPHDLVRFALWFAIPGVVTAAVFVLAAGSVPTLVETMTIVLKSPSTNDYALHFGAGPWFRPIVDYLLVLAGPDAARDRLVRRDRRAAARRRVRPHERVLRLPHRAPRPALQLLHEEHPLRGRVRAADPRLRGARDQRARRKRERATGDAARRRRRRLPVLARLDDVSTSSGCTGTCTTR